MCGILQVMNDTTNWTIRTRHAVSGNYNQQTFFATTELRARAMALVDNPNSEVVGVWAYAWTTPNPCKFSD